MNETTHIAVETPAAVETTTIAPEQAALVFEPHFVATSQLSSGIVTHYGASYAGQTMACGGVYVSEDPSIIAVSTLRDREWGCGTQFEVCGAAGCIKGTRVDSCPGCGRNHLDLSEAGIAQVCGDQAGLCDVTFQTIELVEHPPASVLAADQHLLLTAQELPAEVGPAPEQDSEPEPAPASEGLQ